MNMSGPDPSHNLTSPRIERSRAARRSPAQREALNDVENAIRFLTRNADAEFATDVAMRAPSQVAHAFARFFHRSEASGDGFRSTLEGGSIPFKGRAHFATFARGRVLGISIDFEKLACVPEDRGRGVTMQEELTDEVADMIETALSPKGAAVVLETVVRRPSDRGDEGPAVIITTGRLLGLFKDDIETRRRFLDMVERRFDPSDL